MAERLEIRVVRMESNLSHIVEAFKSTNEKLDTVIKRHEERIVVLETARSNQKYFIAGISLVMGGLASLVGLVF